VLGRCRQRESVSRPSLALPAMIALAWAERRLEVDLLASLDRQHNAFEDHQDSMGEIKGSLAGGCSPSRPGETQSWVLLAAIGGPGVQTRRAVVDVTAGEPGLSRMG
jgi:hypothetical protein